MYENLKNKIIDKSKKEWKDFPDFLDGYLFIEYDNGFVAQEVVNKVKIEVPNSITMRQARLYLLNIDLLDAVEEIITQNRKWQIEWEYAIEVKRDSFIVEAIQNSFNLTDEQIDSMFVEANKI